MGLFTREALTVVGLALIPIAGVVGIVRLLVGPWAAPWVLAIYVSVLLGFWLGRFGRD